MSPGRYWALGNRARMLDHCLHIQRVLRMTLRLDYKGNLSL